MSLHLGSEIFDVHKQSLMQGDHNHLFIRQGTGLQGQAVFRTKLSFRCVPPGAPRPPHSSPLRPTTLLVLVLHTPIVRAGGTTLDVVLV